MEVKTRGGRDSPVGEVVESMDVRDIVAILSEQIRSAVARVDSLTMDIGSVGKKGSSEFIGLLEDMRLDELEQLQELVSKLTNVVAEDYADRRDGKGISALKCSEPKEVHNATEVK